MFRLRLIDRVSERETTRKTLAAAAGRKEEGKKVVLADVGMPLAKHYVHLVAWSTHRTQRTDTADPSHALRHHTVQSNAVNLVQPFSQRRPTVTSRVSPVQSSAVTVPIGL